MLTVYPPRDEIDHLVPALEAGERLVYETLVEHLDRVPQQWHLIVQPHLLGDHPDFVLVAAHHGVTVLEVKNWDPGCYRNVAGVLMVYDGRQGGWQIITDPRQRDPLSVVHGYRTHLSRTYLTPPGDEEAITHVRGCLVLPQWGERDAKEFFRSLTELEEKDSGYIGVMGDTALREPGRLAAGGRSSPREGIPEAWVTRFLARIAEPLARAEGRRPLELSAGARNVARNRDRARRRHIRGPAGSGKTVGIAARAGELALGEQHILVLTYNITLAHYVQDLVRRHCRAIGADAHLVDVMHFHGYCLDVVGRNAQFDGPDGLVRLAMERYAARSSRARTFDAVLVDEGQDFQFEWWDFLRRDVLRRGGECLIAIDTTQTLYGDHGWIDGAMPERDLPRPTHLEGSYRLPPDMVPLVNQFAGTYLTRELDLPSIPADRDAAIPGSVRRWINVPDHDLAARATEQVVALCEQDGVTPADVVVLASHALGMRVMPAVEARIGMPAEYIFADDDEERRNRKHRFWPGVAALKGATVHSFKGWESGALVICLDQHMSREEGTSLAVLAYVALTRAKATAGGRPAHVTVVNGVRQFDTFAATFQRQVSTAEAEALAGQVVMEMPDDESPF